MRGWGVRAARAAKTQRARLCPLTTPRRARPRLAPHPATFNTRRPPAAHLVGLIEHDDAVVVCRPPRLGRPRAPSNQLVQSGWPAAAAGDGQGGVWGGSGGRWAPGAARNRLRRLSTPSPPHRTAPTNTIQPPHLNITPAPRPPPLSKVCKPGTTGAWQPTAARSRAASRCRSADVDTHTCRSRPRMRESCMIAAIWRPLPTPGKRGRWGGGRGLVAREQAASARSSQPPIPPLPPHPPAPSPRKKPARSPLGSHCAWRAHACSTPSTCSLDRRCDARVQPSESHRGKSTAGKSTALGWGLQWGWAGGTVGGAAQVRGAPPGRARAGRGRPWHKNCRATGMRTRPTFNPVP